MGKRERETELVSLSFQLLSPLSFRLPFLLSPILTRSERLLVTLCPLQCYHCRRMIPPKAGLNVLEEGEALMNHSVSSEIWKKYINWILEHCSQSSQKDIQSPQSLGLPFAPVPFISFHSIWSQTLLFLARSDWCWWRRWWYEYDNEDVDDVDEDMMMAQMWCEICTRSRRIILISFLCLFIPKWWNVCEMYTEYE